MFLIMSAAYIGQELQSVFGRMPPSFLPLGNRRLFTHQIKLGKASSDSVFLALPHGYKVPEIDRVILAENNVKLLFLREKLSLGEAVVAALSQSLHDFNEPFELLFGDTLFTELPHGENFLSYSRVSENYHWAVIANNDRKWLHQSEGEEELTNDEVVNGFFRFSKPRDLLNALSQSNWNFLEALNKYKECTDFVSQKSDSWLDFGHLNTYFSSKAHFTTQRSFNNLKITPNWVEKSSNEKDQKIAAESNWFKELPHSLRFYTPQYLGEIKREDVTCYQLEYLHLTALNELYVFADLSIESWKRILNNCMSFLVDCSKKYKPADGFDCSLSELFNNKTKDRLQVFVSQRSIDINDVWCIQGMEFSIKGLLEVANKHLPPEKDIVSIMHGDFCFSNILYDSRSNRIKTIDPRGITPNGKISIYGNVFYDIAKLSHSVLGLYDFIIAGYCKASLNSGEIKLEINISEKHRLIQEYFTKLVQKEFSLTPKQLTAMQIHLFLSMLPLHCDDLNRQNALFANAFRLGRELVNLK